MDFYRWKLLHEGPPSRPGTKTLGNIVSDRESDCLIPIGHIRTVRYPTLLCLDTRVKSRFPLKGSIHQTLGIKTTLIYNILVIVCSSPRNQNVIAPRAINFGVFLIWF